MSYRQFRDGFAAAMDPAFHRIEELDAKVASGQALLWVGRNAATVTEVVEMPGGLAIHGLVATGDLREIVGELIPQAEAWAVSAGCKFALIESRPGWQRVLRERGYEVHQVSVMKEL